MDRSKLILLIRTLKYLKLKQIYYQLFYKIRNKFFKKEYTKALLDKPNSLNWNDSFFNPDTFSDGNTFMFLNYLYEFKNSIDWNHSKYGKLWTYNLNYFDFLNQKNMSKEQGIILIREYINQDRNLKDGKEPYPISLRGINWVKFLSKHDISETSIDQTLYNHYQTLIHNLEHHLLGNHLLENGYSLLFGAYYFKDEILYKKARKILTNELNEQILEDGAHFELSPMYHQILLYRLLDCIYLIDKNLWKKDYLIDFLKQKAIKMLSWLEEITFNDGNIPMVNDSTYGIAPSSNELFEYAKSIKLSVEKTHLNESGYRMIRKDEYELFIDVGDIGPSYQPGHAHSDTFNFELYLKNAPFIVDTGVSTYEKNKLRLKQRQTASHNTVKVGDFEQSEVWSGFRVARRAKVVSLKEEQNYIEATHNGYKKWNILHTRKFCTNDSSIEIHDNISKLTAKEQIAFFHLHPSVSDFKVSENKIYFPQDSINIYFEGDSLEIRVEEYEYAIGFNRTQKAKKIVVNFNKELNTKFIL